MSKSTKDLNEISEICVELENLRLEQVSLNNRITSLEGRLREWRKGKTLNKRSKLTLEEYRSKIGKTVKIVNPKPNEPSVGSVIKVGSLYITVELPNGTRRRRIASNLLLLEDV